MREIKFRAWYDWKMFEEALMWAWLVPQVCNSNMDWVNLCIAEEEYSVMQYTWLKDKNWKEIYEGDVVEYPQNFDNSAFWLMCPKSSGEIKYIDEYAQFNISWYFWGEDFYKNTQMIEVIWNVYENPELLEFNS